MSKTTNPALMKRFFNGTAEVGDCSKDMVIEPAYALVFCGKVPYQHSPNPRIMAWLPKNETQYHVYRKNAYPKAIEKMLLALMPEDSYIIGVKTDLYYAMTLINRLAIGNEPDSRDLLIQRLNYHLQYVKQEKVWEIIDNNPDTYSSLWTNVDKNMRGVDDKFGVEIIARRLMS